jgi:hypothetical protein
VAGSVFDPSSRTPDTSTRSEEVRNGTAAPFLRYTTAMSWGHSASDWQKGHKDTGCEVRTKNVASGFSGGAM